MGDFNIGKYLNAILKFEIEKYVLQKSINNIDITVKQLGKTKNNYTVPVVHRVALFDGNVILGSILLIIIPDAIVALVLGWIFNKGVAYITLSIGVAIFFLFIIGLSQVNRAKNKEYEVQNKSELNEYKQNIENEKKRVATENANKIMLQKSRTLLYSQYQKVSELLLKMYSLNVIYPKYRNMIAVASFVEYIDSGRCHALTGHEGAYNIYETEVRLDRIITNQEEILIRLEQIRDNQHMLYSAISSANKEIEKLSSAYKSQTKVIAQNNEIIAYNTRCAAEESRALKNYIIWRDLLQ